MPDIIKEMNLQVYHKGAIQSSYGGHSVRHNYTQFAKHCLIGLRGCMKSGSLLTCRKFKNCSAFLS